jgi:methylglutaconyl-CoA hydratase
MTTSVEVTRDGEVLRITLCRPESHNAFDATLVRELAEAFVDVGKARCVVLAGQGASLSAGADAEWLRAMGDRDLDANVANATAVGRLFETIDSCPAPVVALVQGQSLGGGTGLVACADIAIAQTRAVFGFPEVKLGLAPAVMSPFVIGRIGEAAARRYFLTGERFDAATALRLGLVDEVADDLDAALERIVAELLTSAPRATRAAKRIVLDRPDGRELARRIGKLRGSPEGREGLEAFLAGRVPGSPGFASWSPEGQGDDAGP